MEDHKDASRNELLAELSFVRAMAESAQSELAQVREELAKERLEKAAISTNLGQVVSEFTRLTAQLRFLHGSIDQKLPAKSPESVPMSQNHESAPMSQNHVRFDESQVAPSKTPAATSVPEQRVVNLEHVSTEADSADVCVCSMDNAEITAIATEGENIFCGDDQGSVSVWIQSDINSLPSKDASFFVDGPVSCLLAAPVPGESAMDSDLLIVAGTTKGNVCGMRRRDGETQWKQQFSFVNEGLVTGMVSHSSGEWIEATHVFISASNGAMYSVPTDTGRPFLIRSPGDRVTAMAILPSEWEEAYLLSAVGKGVEVLTMNGDLKRTLVNPHGEDITALSTSDESVIACADSDGNVLIWSAEWELLHDVQVGRHVGNGGLIARATKAPSFFTGCYDGNIMLWMQQRAGFAAMREWNVSYPVFQIIRHYAKYLLAVANGKVFQLQIE